MKIWLSTIDLLFIILEVFLIIYYCTQKSFVDEKTSKLTMIIIISLGVTIIIIASVGLCY